MVAPRFMPMPPPGAVPQPPPPMPGPPMGGAPGLPPGPFPPGGMAGPPPMGMMPPGPEMPPTTDAPLPAPPPEPDPLELLMAHLGSLEPDELRDLLKKLKKKERDTLLKLTAEADPDLYAKLQAAMPLPKDYEPERPRWYKQPPKPEIETILSIARKDYDAHQDLRTQFRDDFNAYMNRTWGRFQTDLARDPYADDSAVFVSTALSSEINMRAAMLAEHEIAYQLPPMKPDLLDETQRCENFLHYLDDLAERRHANRGSGSLKYEIAWNFQVYGRAIMRRMLDLDDPNDPVDELLVDPATCCPIWGGKHGLLRVTRWYSASIIDVARDFDADPETVAKPKYSDAAGKPYRELSIENTINVVEWYDEHWWAVLAEDGRVIKPVTAHKYGEVPFVIRLVSRGLPAAFTDPDQKTSDPMDPAGTQRKNDLKLKGLSSVYWMKFTHRQREAFIGKIADALLKSDNPPIWLGMDTFSKNQPTPKLGTRRGKVYPFDMQHHKPEIPQYAPIPPIVAPLMESLSAEWGMAALPAAVYGGDTPPNTSGAALDGLTEGGMSKITVDALAIASFYEARAEQTLRWWRDWGQLVEDAEGRYGVMTVPVKRKSPTGPASFELTPDVIERTGTRVKVKLTNIRLAQLGAVGAAFLQLVNSPKPLMTQRDALERLGNPDPDAVVATLDYEAMRDDQRARNLRMLAALLERTGEPIDAKELAQLQTKLFAAGLIQDMGQAEGGQGAAPPPQGGPPGGPPGMPAPPGVSAGVNMGNYGSPPGANGGPVGRPPLENVGP